MMPATSRRTSSMRCGTISVARFARIKDQTAHGTWPRKHSVHGLVAQKRRAGVLATRRVPALGQRSTRAPARAGGRAVPAVSKNIAHVPLNLPQHTSPDPKMPQDPRKGAIMAWARICVIIREDRNQTIKCRTKIKESIPLVNTTIPYHPEKESKQSKYR